jgi:hypothetical protein
MKLAKAVPEKLTLLTKRSKTSAGYDRKHTKVPASDFSTLFLN